VADHRHQFPVSPRLGPKDAEAVLRIVEGDALDKARQGFLGRRVSWALSRDAAAPGAPEWKDYVALISCLILWPVPVPASRKNGSIVPRTTGGRRTSW
jgi:hypothetical protein